MMGIAAPRILIVDDKPEHGEAIARTLWRLGYASLFVLYDQAALANGDYGPYQGVRLIFMDIDLAGTGSVGNGSIAYADVVATIKSILDSNNGPWVLVTWTGHADHAERLLSYLKDPDRLPEELQPISNDVMEKEKFIHDDGTDRNGAILPRLKEVIRQDNATGCLLGWEAGVWESANQVVAELSQTANQLKGDDIHKNLGHLLYELARAAAGKTIDDLSDYAPALYEVLTSLLSDKLSVWTPEAQDSCKQESVSAVDDGEEIADWKRRINTMINLEMVKDSTNSSPAPGSLIAFPETPAIEQISNINSIKEAGKFVRRHFLCFQKATAKADRKQISEKCGLYFLDTTPPCDHAQKKAVWRRYVVACKVPVDIMEHAWFVDYKSDEKTEGRLKADYLLKTPEFIDDDGAFVLIINANLQLSVSDQQIGNIGQMAYRIRETLMADILSWIGRHITRLGHVYLPTP